MRRREFIVLLGGAAAAWPPIARGQERRVPRIGALVAGNTEPFLTEFRAGLREQGYVAGESILIEMRAAQGRLQALPELAAELVRLDVDILVASETPSVQAVKQATTRIPIVMAPSGDPVGTGLIKTLAQPGGNITGLSAATAELAGKSLEILREILPAMKHIGTLAEPTNPFTRPFLEQIGRAADALGVKVDSHMVRNAAEFETAFAQMAAAPVDAVVVQPTLPRPNIIALALKHRLATVSGNRAFADGGGLLSYAASLADRYRNAAVYVDKILKGSAPADLPVQQPARFELVINGKTAKTLDLQIPPSLLARADEVIE